MPDRPFDVLVADVAEDAEDEYQTSRGKTGVLIDERGVAHPNFDAWRADGRNGSSGSHGIAWVQLHQSGRHIQPAAMRRKHLSREQVYRLVTAPPQRLSMDVLAAVCDIPDCTPNDLIEITVVNAEVRKTATGEAGPAASVRRSTIRRPEGL